MIVYSNHRLTRKRRASFHGFGWLDNRSKSSLFRHSSLNDDSLNASSHQSDYEFLDTVRRSTSLDSLVNRNMVDWFIKEADTIDENDSSTFSFDLAVRAEKYGKL